MKHIQKRARGTYYCVADNGVGRGSKRNVAVEVEFAPVITVPRPKVYQVRSWHDGIGVDMRCRRGDCVWNVSFLRARLYIEAPLFGFISWRFMSFFNG